MNFEYQIKKSKGRNVRISINRETKVFLHVPRFFPAYLAKKFLESKRGWILEKIGEQKKHPLAPSFKKRGDARKEYLEKKEEARKIVLEKLEFWKKFYKENFQIDFVWKNVSIKNSKTRWGSCSSKKNLNFSYKIHSLPESAQDYLIVHELSHLLQMNHSKNFWKLVALGVPDWKEQKNFLKTFRSNIF